MLGGSVEAGSTYIDHCWTCDDLTALIRIFCRNQAALSDLDGGLVWLQHLMRGVHYWRQRNTRSGSDQNIRAHYDIGNDLFSAMLDPLMMYSSAIYPSGDTTLDEAAAHKCQVLINELDVQPQHRVLEIGCGWGGFACELAERVGCHVHAITISREQESLAKQRVIDRGLEHLVTIERIDYRDIQGQYDRLVSIEMIEAVGKQFYGTFFEQVSRLLRPDGLMAMQAITIADQAFDRASREVDFIKRYIFPGSCIPSVNALSVAAQRSTNDVRLHQTTDYGVHYARTLADWWQRISTYREQHPHDLQQYDDRFWRMWQFYLQYCEGGFAERSIGLHHMIFAKDGWRSPQHQDLGYGS